MARYFEGLLTPEQEAELTDIATKLGLAMNDDPNGIFWMLASFVERQPLKDNFRELTPADLSYIRALESEEESA